MSKFDILTKTESQFIPSVYLRVSVRPPAAHTMKVSLQSVSYTVLHVIMSLVD